MTPNTSRNINQTNITAENINNIHSGSGDIISNSISEKSSLVEAAAEIQQLLSQLEETNPTATEIEQIQYVNIATRPELKARVKAAFLAGSEKAIEEFVLENKYLKVGKEIVKAWTRGKV